MTTAPESAPLLSLILPAYNEEGRLPHTLRAIRRFLAEQPYAAEVIVVDDGSADATAALVERRALRWPKLRLVRTPHRGKWSAVRAGLLASRGAYCFLCDADLSMPISELVKFIPPQETDGAVVIASREALGAHRYHEPSHRHVLGRVFNALVRALALPGVQDSQCGFKCLPGGLSRRLAAAMTIDGWGFDVELLYVARLWGHRIVETPIAWHYAPSSRIHPLRDSWRMTREVMRVRRNARLGLYAQPSPVPSEVAVPSAQ
ncbi:MAG: glycosyltransferase [Ktedonobacterales bacterium]